MTGTVDRPQTRLESWPIRIRELVVLRREYVTPRMVRLTVGGPNHVGFESHIADEHVKVILADESGVVRVPTQDGDWLKWPKPGSPTRDYTVRRYDAEAGEVDLDFVVHKGGIASDWAESVEIGGSVWVAGPPRGVVIPDEFTWQAYLGDETAIPAIARRLAELPRHIRGIVFIEVRDADDEQPLDAPDGFDVRWLHRGDRAPATPDLVIKAAQAVEIPRDGRAYVWYGGESGAIKPLRAWIKAAGLGKHEFDAVGYWRRGAAGDQVAHHGIGHTLKHLLRIDH